MNKKHIFITSFFAIVFLFIQNSNAQNSFEILAKVNNEVITKLDVNRRLELLSELSKNKYTGQNRKYIEDQILLLMVEEQLKMQEAKKLGVTVSDGEMSKAITQIESINHMKKGQLYNILKQKNLSKDSLLQQIKSDILWQKIVYQKIIPTIEVKEFEVNEAIEYMVKDSKRKVFKLAEIFIPINLGDGRTNKKEVEQVVNKIAEDIRIKNNFEEMVRQFSRSTTASKGGEIGWIEERSLSKEIADELSNTSIKSITNPIFVGTNDNGGYYIFQIQDIKVEQKITDENKKDIMNYIYRNKIEAEAKNYINKMYKENFVEMKVGYYSLP